MFAQLSIRKTKKTGLLDRIAAAIIRIGLVNSGGLRFFGSSRRIEIIIYGAAAVAPEPAPEPITITTTSTIKHVHDWSEDVAHASTDVSEEIIEELSVRIGG